MKALEELGLVKVNEAAEFLSLSKSKIYQMMESGDLPYIRFGRARRIPKHVLIELVGGVS